MLVTGKTNLRGKRGGKPLGNDPTARKLTKSEKAGQDKQGKDREEAASAGGRERDEASSHWGNEAMKIGKSWEY